MKNLISGVIVAFMLTSCASKFDKVEFTALSENVYPAKQAGSQIEIFRTSLPDRPYKEIGIIMASGGGTNSVFGSSNFYENTMILLKEEARRRGGDAVIDIREKQGGWLALTGTLIKWQD